MPRSHKPEPISTVYNSRYGASIKQGTNGHCPKSPCGTHHWHIDSPDGETSRGECQYCRTDRMFYNTIDAAVNVGAGRRAVGRAM